MKPVSIISLAQREIDAAASFYENRGEGLGVEFADRVEEVLQNIEIAPLGFQKVFGDLWLCGLRQFTDWSCRMSPLSWPAYSVGAVQYWRRNAPPR